jgi:hypothetical protein
VRTQLAVVGVVDRDQRVDAGALGGVELVFLQLASIGRQRAEIVAQEEGGLQKGPTLPAFLSKPIGSVFRGGNAWGNI